MVVSITLGGSMLGRAKSIAVVGNASSIFTADHGADIDKHDIVIRMNRGLPTDPQRQGRKTNILAFSVFSMVSGIYSDFGAEKLIWMSPKRRDEAPTDINLEFYSLDRWEALQAKLGSRPSVGAMVLDYVSTASPASVTIFGFDFKKTKTFYEKQDKDCPHDFEAEEAFCRRLSCQENWALVEDSRHIALQSPAQPIKSGLADFFGS